MKTGSKKAPRRGGQRQQPVKASTVDRNNKLDFVGRIVRLTGAAAGAVAVITRVILELTQIHW